MYEKEKEAAFLASAGSSTQIKKAEEMDEAIRYVFQVVRSAEQLLMSISEPHPVDPSEISDNKEPPPSIESILNYGPQRIRAACDEIHVILDKITKVLI